MEGGDALLERVVLMGAVGKEGDTGGGCLRLEGVGVVLVKKGEVVEEVGGKRVVGAWGV